MMRWAYVMDSQDAPSDEPAVRILAGRNDHAEAIQRRPHQHPDNGDRPVRYRNDTNGRGPVR